MSFFIKFIQYLSSQSRFLLFLWAEICSLDFFSMLSNNTSMLVCRQAGNPVFFIRRWCNSDQHLMRWWKKLRAWIYTCAYQSSIVELFKPEVNMANFMLFTQFFEKLEEIHPSVNQFGRSRIPLKCHGSDNWSHFWHFFLNLSWRFLYICP